MGFNADFYFVIYFVKIQSQLGRVTDTGTFTAGTIDDIGQYTVSMITYQDSTNPDHGYFSPFRGVLAQVEQ